MKGRPRESCDRYDRCRGLVCVLGHELMALAIEKARNVGVGVVTMYNGGDAGRLGYYAALAAAQNMVGMVASAQGLRVVPVFGSKPRLGTNPIAIAAPAKSKVPLIFDTATTASAFGWLRVIETAPRFRRAQSLSSMERRS